MTTLDDHLSSLRPTDTIDLLVRDVAIERSIETDRRSNYVSVRPTPVGAIAFYAYSHGLAIAVDPHAAADAVRRLPGSRAKVITPATTHVQVEDAGSLSALHDELVAVCVEAVDWRASGPNRTLGVGHAGRVAVEPDICPTCHTEITKASTCLC